MRAQHTRMADMVVQAAMNGHGGKVLQHGGDYSQVVRAPINSYSAQHGGNYDQVVRAPTNANNYCQCGYAPYAHYPAHAFTAAPNHGTQQQPYIKSAH